MLWIIISLAVFSFVLLIILGHQDERNASLKAENGLLKDRLSTTPEVETEKRLLVREKQDYLRPLSIETAMEAIRYNGYVPESDGKWICFMVQGERFFVDVTGTPIAHFVYPFSLDDSTNLTNLKKATDILPERIIISRAHIDNDQQGISFVVDGIEHNYGHFRDSLCDYIHLLYETRARHKAIYEDLQSRPDKEKVFDTWANQQKVLS